MPDGPPRRRHARPVADAPVDALLLRLEDLTKAWLLALLEETPLDDAPALGTAQLVRDGPRVCDAVVRALASDDDLQRIEEGGVLEPLVSQIASFAGRGAADAVCRSADALGAVIWSGIREEVSRPDPDQISELSERLTRVIGLVRGAALRRSGNRETHTAGPAVVPRLAPEQIRDAPASSGDPLWRGALEEEIQQAERTGAALSLLLVELEDADRVLAAEAVHEAAAAFGRFAQAVRSAARRQDILACETETRAWIIARETTRAGARALGKRIVAAVRAAHSLRGAPLTVNLGLAVYGEDGRDGAALIESAEQMMFSAAASGNDLADGPGEE
jgi:GGDEF domain-containing protein